MGRYMPPKKTGTALMGQRAEEITKHNLLLYCSLSH